jgi:hypothetical protein
MVSQTIGYIAGVNTIFSPLVGKTTNGGANWTFSSFYLNSNEGTLRDLYFSMFKTGLPYLTYGTAGSSITDNKRRAKLDDPDFCKCNLWCGFSHSINQLHSRIQRQHYEIYRRGNNWVQQTSGTNAFLKAIDFVDSVNGFAAGDGGVILKTTNGE